MYSIIADPHVRFAVHLSPVGKPAGGAADGKQNGKHVFGNARRFQDEAKVEIDVGV